LLGDSLLPDSKTDGADFCRARLALPLALFRKMLRFLGWEIQRNAGAPWRGLTVYYVDGTTLPLFNSKKNRAAFGGSRNQNGESRMPIARVVLLVSAGAIVDLVCGPYAASELRLFYSLLRQLSPESLVVGDTLYNSFFNMASARARGSHMLCRSRAQRHANVIGTLGRGDRLHRWTKPQREHTLIASAWESLPSTLTVRVITRTVRRKGYRDYVLTLTTTMLDPVRYPAEELVALYLSRWNIELDLRTLKAVHGWARLKCKTPQSVHREIFSGALAFNAVRLLMSQSGKPIRSLSHSGANQTLIETASRMSAARTESLPAMLNHALANIARQILDKTARLPQPRLLAYNLRRYGFLKTSRAQWRKENDVAS
ncbi:MAG TPA: IS4 family transposase, partial [Candidatus Acidoferrum sp.]